MPQRGSIRALYVTADPDLSDRTAALEREADRLAVETADSAAAGIERVTETRVDCVVSDYRLPETDGIALLRRLREGRPDLPFVLVAGDGDEQVAAEAVSAGATDYVPRTDGATGRLAEAVTAAVDEYRAIDGPTAAVADAAADLCVVTDADGRLRRWDDGLTAAVGRETRLAGADLASVLPVDDRDRVEELVAETLSTGRGSREVTVRRDDEGEERRYELVGDRLTDGSGAATGLVCVGRDVTERRRRRRRLESADALFRHARDGLFVVDVASDGFTARRVNPAIEEMLGVSAGALEGAGPREILDVERGTEVAARLRECVAEGETVAYKQERRVDGETTHWAVRLAPVTFDGSVERVVGTVRDITEGERRKREVAEVRARMEFALERTDAVIWEQDSETDAVTTYPTPDPVFGKTIEAEAEFVEQIRPEDRDRVAERTRTAFETGEPYTIEYRTVEDGQWVQDVCEPVCDESGEVTRLTGLTRDVTERKRRERELRRKNDRLEKFASVVSHDLRNPLTVAQGRLELVDRDCDHEQLDAVRQAHGRMESLIEDLLTLARTGGPVEDPDPVDLGALAEECWQGVATGDATLVTETDRAVPADPVRLQRLLTNLVQNAVEHGSANRADAVTVTVGDCEGGFYVADDGPGVPPADRDRVFESGYSSSEEGTGLGLSIVADAAEAHGWSVDVTESAAGGARFEVTGVE